MARWTGSDIRERLVLVASHNHAIQANKSMKSSYLAIWLSAAHWFGLGMLIPPHRRS